VAGVLVLGAVAAVGAVLVPGPTLRHDPGSPCVAVVELDRALDLASLGDQAVVRARAAALADALARRAAGDEAVERDGLVAQQLLVLLEDPGATMADLVDVVRPVAQDCDVALRAAAASPAAGDR
jgi:hypothetical protein